jgi:hypothetical protein
MNEVKLTGKVLNAYAHELSGAFITKIAVRHDHIVGRQSVSCESVFNVVMLDENKIKLADWKQGDTVMVTGYLKIDFKKSPRGNEHQKLTVYATDIEIVKQKDKWLI